jgi:hypothetical protein
MPAPPSRTTGVVEYASAATKPQRGAWWLVRELLAGAVMFAFASGIFSIGAGLWWNGPVGRLGGALYVAAIVVPMAVGSGGWALLAVLLAKAFREWRT